MLLISLFAAGLPVAATEVAVKWDILYNFILVLSALFVFGIVGVMIYFSIVYRHDKVKSTKYILDNHLLEATWTIIPTILLLGIFYWGWAVYRDMTQPPSDAIEIKVVGKQWAWAFQYPDGRITNSEVFVPINKPVKLIMSSEDVIHSFFVPNFRIKQDVVPGMYTSVWFQATMAGSHQVFCTEYCGTAHSSMLAKIHVLTDEQWAKFNLGREITGLHSVGVGGMAMPLGAAVPGAQALSGLALQGEKLTQSKGCVACHSSDGSVKIGPSYKGVFDSTIELADGSKVKADINYLRESIENPQAKIVKNFQPLMPTYKGQLSEPELNAVIEYIKAVK